MADENISVVTPPATVEAVTPVAAPVIPVTPTTDDIITRASKFIEQNAPVAPVEPVEFNSQELNALIDGVTDPATRELLIKKVKSLDSGYGRKFQNLAEQVKKVESILAQVQQPQSWTPDRVKSALQDPTFIQSSQAYLNSDAAKQGFTETEYSQLTDVEKAELGKVPQLQQELNVLKNERYLAQKQQQDTQLKEKYHNYEPSVIDKLTTDLISGKIQATREDLFKVHDYEAMATRSYKMGVLDGQNQNKERLNASSLPGSNIVPNGDVPVKESGQQSKAYFLELARRRMAESDQMAGAKK